MDKIAINCNDEFEDTPVSYGKSISDNKISIFPNTFSNTITVQAKCDGVVSIIKSAGQPVFEQPINGFLEIDASTLLPGAYYIIIKNKNEEVVYSEKTIKL